MSPTKPSKTNPERKRLHDMQNAATVLSDFVDMVDEGFDFSSEEGKKHIAEALEAKELLVRDIMELRRQQRR
jgi:hypothetical protein